MPTEREDDKKHQNSLPSISKAASVSSTLAPAPLPQLPHDIIISIIKRLPLKSIARFKFLSKYWLSFLSTPEFISMYREQTSMNHSFIIPRPDKDYCPKISLINVNSTEQETISLFKPFSGIYNKIELVGSVNGLVCLSYPPLYETVVLCNPAINLYKAVRHSTTTIWVADEKIQGISMGFAYDSVNDDYKIFRIASLKPVSPAPFFRYRVAVYSASLDYWKAIEIDSPFVFSTTRSNVIANGIPYWTGFIYQPNNHRKGSEIFVYFDLRNGGLNYIPLPRVPTCHDGKGVQFVEWKGNLGAIIFSRREDIWDILVYDEIGMCWNKITSHGPIGFNMRRLMHCFEDAMILAETTEGKLMLYDPVTNGIKEFCFAGAPGLFYEDLGTLRAWLLSREWCK